MVYIAQIHRRVPVQAVSFRLQRDLFRVYLISSTSITGNLLCARNFSRDWGNGRNTTGKRIKTKKTNTFLMLPSCQRTQKTSTTSKSQSTLKL
jgi:hypothetical protein